MKKILIIGASFLQLPAIRKAKDMGLFVGVVDYNPDAVGIRYADKYFNASTIDEDAVCRVASEFMPDGIMTLATDMPMRSVAKATSLLGLPGISYQTAVKATDKYEMIKAFKANGVSSPWFFEVSSVDEISMLKDKLSYPCIMKPTDNAGSRGVVLLHSYEDLINSYQYSSKESRSGNVIIEEYLKGQEVSVEVMVIDNNVHILQVTDKLTTGAPHFVELGHSQPSQLSFESIQQICTLAVKAVKAIGINVGPAHVEMMMTEHGPVMIELGARMGGDCITTHLVPLSTGIDMVKSTIEVSMGVVPDLSSTLHMGSAIRFISGKPGHLKSLPDVTSFENDPEVREITFTKNVGDVISAIHSSIDRTGYVVVQSTSVEKAVAKCEKIVERIVQLDDFSIVNN